MAQFDVKNANIYFTDGYGQDGTVNNVAGYAGGVTTMTVDGIVGALANGDRFTVVGETGAPIHTITAHTETSSNTTSITFTPGLASAVVDDDVFNVISHKLRVRTGDGNISYTERKPRTYVKDRGRLDTVRNADEEPMDVRLDFMWEFLESESGATVPTIEEVLKKKGAASTWVSSDADPCAPYSVDISIEYDPDCPSVDDELIVLEDFRYEELGHDAKAGMISCSGKCNRIEASVERVEQLPA